jgi:hypothetical protein
MGTVFGLISALAWLVGLFNVNNATAGVFCAATACWLAILVRLHEAQKQHDELMNFLTGKEQERIKQMQSGSAPGQPPGL